MVFRLSLSPSDLVERRARRRVGASVGESLPSAHISLCVFIASVTLSKTVISQPRGSSADSPQSVLSLLGAAIHSVPALCSAALGFRGFRPDLISTTLCLMFHSPSKLATRRDTEGELAGHRMITVHTRHDRGLGGRGQDANRPRAASSSRRPQTWRRRAHLLSDRLVGSEPGRASLACSSRSHRRLWFSRRLRPEDTPSSLCCLGPSTT